MLKSTPSFRGYSNLPFEFLIAAFTVVPILILIYFYPTLPDRVPEYLNLRGEVEVWGRKGFGSVFRLPLMAIDLQVLCLLTKYGVWQGSSITEAGATDREKQLTLSLRLFDWFRAFIAVKLASSSLEVIVFSVELYQYLTKVTRATSWIASIIGVAGAVVYCYRLLLVNRRLKAPGVPEPSTQTQSFFYFNRSDPAWFTKNHAPNFGNKWIYVFVLCLLVLPVLMFWPMLSAL